MRSTPDHMQGRLASAFAVLHFDQKAFNPKFPDPLNEHFRGLGKKMHPDRFPLEERKAAEARFSEVTTAFHFIMDNLHEIRTPPVQDPDPAQNPRGTPADGPIKTQTPISVLDEMARKGEWAEIVHAVSGSPQDHPLSAHALTLMEKDYKRVLSSGQREAVSFLCLHTAITSMIPCALRADPQSAGMLVGIMGSRGMWKELRDNVLLGRGPRAASISAMEDNAARIIAEGREEFILFLWENASRGGLRQDMLEKLASSERPDAVKPILQRMADRKMAKSLAYCADTVFRSDPRLRRYALMLREIVLADAITREAPPRYCPRAAAVSHSYA